MQQLQQSLLQLAIVMMIQYVSGETDYSWAELIGCSNNRLPNSITLPNDACSCVWGSQIDMG